MVQIGRVALVNYGPEEGKLCVIVDVVDGRRALICLSSQGVARQQMPFNRLSLTEFLVDIKRNQNAKAVDEAFAKADILSKWNQTTAGQARARRLRRATLTDFERFQVMVNRKRKSAEVKKSLKKN